MSRKMLSMLTLGATVKVFTEVIDRKKITFTAAVGDTAETADAICTADGKLKKYQQLDSFIAEALGVNPSIETVNFVCDTAGVRTITIPKDAVAAAVKEKAKLETAKVKSLALQTSLTAELAARASYEHSSNAFYANAYAETAAQLAAVGGVITYQTDRIAALTLIITPA